VSILLVGTLNTLSYKVLYTVYSSRYAYFVSNGINVLYVLFGGALLYPRMYCNRSGKIPEDLRKQPQKKFIVMALLDAFGTFFSAMGSVKTPGYLQTILNQTLIPILMLTSFFALGTRFSPLQISGATLIVLGAFISSIDSVFDPESTVKDQGYKISGEGWSEATAYSLEKPASSSLHSSCISHTTTSNNLPLVTSLLASLIAVIFYLVSNIPYAFSAVYKEVAFKNQKTDVMYLTQQVSIYQMLIGFAMLPLTSIPGVASSDGMSVGKVRRIDEQVDIINI